MSYKLCSICGIRFSGFDTTCIECRRGPALKDEFDEVARAQAEAQYSAIDKQSFYAGFLAGAHWVKDTQAESGEESK